MDMRNVRKSSTDTGGLRPTEVAHGPAGVPNLCHMPDFVAVEFHDIDVIGAGALACRWAGTTLAGMGCRKYTVSAHALAFIVRGEGFHDVPPVRHEGQQPLHPFRIGLQCADFDERL